jgi:hypothetical protein
MEHMTSDIRGGALTDLDLVIATQAHKAVQTHDQMQSLEQTYLWLHYLQCELEQLIQPLCASDFSTVQ